MTEQKATNVTWHGHSVTSEERQALLGQKGAVIWITGLSGSGKSTIANAVAFKLHEMKKMAYVLDGDNVRQGLNKNLGFSPEDRKENIRRISEVANLFADSGLIAITAFISPYAEDRDFCRELLGEGKFIEIYAKTPLDVCEERDPKGLYKKARDGIIKEFTGISAPYEEPENAEIILETDKETEDESAQKVIDYLMENGFLD